MRKMLIGINIVLLSILVYACADTIITFLSFSSSISFCTKSEKDYIRRLTNCNDDYYTIFYKSGFREKSKEVKIIKKNGIIPNIYGKTITIEKTSGYDISTLGEFINNNSNTMTSLLVFLIPYIIPQIIIFYIIKKLLI